MMLETKIWKLGCIRLLQMKTNSRKNTAALRSLLVFKPLASIILIHLIDHFFSDSGMFDIKISNVAQCPMHSIGCEHGKKWLRRGGGQDRSPPDISSAPHVTHLRTPSRQLMPIPYYHQAFKYTLSQKLYYSMPGLKPDHCQDSNLTSVYQGADVRGLLSGLCSLDRLPHGKAASPWKMTNHWGQCWE